MITKFDSPFNRPEIWGKAISAKVDIEPLNESEAKHNHHHCVICPDCQECVL